MDPTLLPGYGLHREKGMVLHVGTYLGDDRVIHLGPSGLRIDSFAAFGAGQQVRVISNEVPLDILEARVEEALQLFNAYGAFWQNCEHLANFLQRGVKESPQLQGAVVVGLGAAVLAKAAGKDSVGVLAFGLLGMWVGASLARP